MQTVFSRAYVKLALTEYAEVLTDLSSVFPIQSLKTPVPVRIQIFLRETCTKCIRQQTVTRSAKMPSFLRWNQFDRPVQFPIPQVQSPDRYWLSWRCNPTESRSVTTPGATIPVTWLVPSKTYPKVFLFKAAAEYAEMYWNASPASRPLLPYEPLNFRFVMNGRFSLMKLFFRKYAIRH